MRPVFTYSVLTYIAVSLFCSVCASFSIPAYAQNQQQSLRFSDVLQKVYDHNLVLKAARERLMETQELYPQARAGWLPSLSAETSVYATDVKNSNFGAADGATTKDITLNVDQPLFRGGRTLAETARAREIIRAGEAILKQAEQDIFLKTATIYMDVLSDRALLTLRQTNEDILQKELTAAQERHELGEATITDVHQAMARYSRARSETITAAGNLDSSAAAFLEVTGIMPPDNLGDPDVLFKFPDHIEEMVALAEKLNPEIRAADYHRQAAEHNADATFRELLPQVSAFASYNKQYDPQPGIIDRAEAKTIGVRATMAFYQGGATRSRIREAQKTARRSRHEIDQIKRQIRRDVTTNQRLYMTAGAETQSRMAEAEAAELALQGVREEAHLGQRTTLDILDADRELVEARAALIRARRNEEITKYTLAASIGILDAYNLGITMTNSIE